MALDAKRELGPGPDSPGQSSQAHPLTATGDVTDPTLPSDGTPFVLKLRDNSHSGMTSADLAWNSLSEKAFKRKVLKNVGCLGTVFCALFAGFRGLTSLQSSLHRQQGMGVVTQSVLYACMTSSALFLPKVFIWRLGHRGTMVVAMVGYITWMVANGYATWVTMTIASALVGLVAAPLWTAQCAYITIIVNEFCKRFNGKSAEMIPVMFGLFSLLMKLGMLVGSVISWAVLSERDHNDTSWHNETSSLYNVTAVCGVADCPWLEEETPIGTYQDPESFTVGSRFVRSGPSPFNFRWTHPGPVWILLAIYIALGIAAVVMVITCVDRLPPSWIQSHDSRTSRALLESLTAALCLHKEAFLWLIIPLSVVSGLRFSFLVAVFFKSHVTCVLGIWYVGLVNLPAQLAVVVMSYAGGWLVKTVGRPVVFSAGLVLDLTFYLTALMWYPDSSQLAVFFGISTIWGVAQGLLDPQLPALYGVLFPHAIEAAFANHKLWQSLGNVIGFVSSRFLCGYQAVYVNLAVLGASAAGYVTLEVTLWRRRGRAQKISEQPGNDTGSDDVVVVARGDISPDEDQSTDAF